MNYTERTKLIDGLSGAALMALLVECFYGISDAAYTVFNYKYRNVTNVIYILGGIALAIAIFMLIKAYKNEKSTLGVYGIELLVLAISAGLLPSTYMYDGFSYPFNRLNVLFPLAFGVYYIMKSLNIISKKNFSNSVMLGCIEAVYIAIITFGLLNFTEILFVLISIVTVGAFIQAIRKKSKFVLVHALEFMAVAFSMLIIDTNMSVVFFGIMIAVYYLLKSIYVTLNSGSVAKKKAKRRK